MESHKYITRKRARFKGLSGKVNIPYGSLLESRGGFLFYKNARLCTVTRSLPSRGAWIEISPCSHLLCMVLSLPSRGAWIEILKRSLKRIIFTRRSPRGERG